jgi:hypothetical protein
VPTGAHLTGPSAASARSPYAGFEVGLADVTFATTTSGVLALRDWLITLLAKAAQAKLLRTTRLRADTTVVPADVAYPTDSGLLARAVRRSWAGSVVLPTLGRAAPATEPRLLAVQ